ncbi:MAG: lipocalin-like domain-containing protein, partial [Rhodoferax sp.]
MLPLPHLKFAAFRSSRRRLLGSVAAIGLLPGSLVQAMPQTRLAFPRDHGAHPDFRTEWWYLTGYASQAGMDAAYGFQLTFFRSRIPTTQSMHSRLAARQLLFAHAAVTDVQGRRLWHDQRAARSSGDRPGSNPTDSAWYSTTNTAVALKDWSLRRDVDGLRARMRGSHFALDLTLAPTQPILLQGDQGLSGKGPNPEQASYYYSQPQLQASGQLTLAGRLVTLAPGSRAWLDHEWSQEILHPEAVGWDWIGINLLDGSALTAFQLRRQDGSALWHG